jgi:hypothetical protein
VTLKIGDSECPQPEPPPIIDDGGVRIKPQAFGLLLGTSRFQVCCKRFGALETIAC